MITYRLKCQVKAKKMRKTAKNKRNDKFNICILVLSSFGAVFITPKIYVRNNSYLNK